MVPGQDAAGPAERVDRSGDHAPGLLYAFGMPNWRPTHGEYVYVQLANELARLIGTGEYPVGSTLPSEAALSKSYRLARPTIRQALAELRDRGLITTLHGVGSVVMAKPPAS
jgi:DNA-binding GntR family transcriptional regulator